MALGPMYVSVRESDRGCDILHYPPNRKAEFSFAGTNGRASSGALHFSYSAAIDHRGAKHRLVWDRSRARGLARNSKPAAVWYRRIRLWQDDPVAELLRQP